MSITAIKSLNTRGLEAACRHLAENDPDLAAVFAKYGTPPLWAREPGFSTLLHIILEQQVSLASAKACFDKLGERVGNVTPCSVLTLTDDEMKEVGFSRQKAGYAKHLAEAILERRLDLEELCRLPDAAAREELIKLKGVGRWTADIYLLMALLRPDVMPQGDLALHIAYQKITGTQKRPDAGEFMTAAERWKPFRSAAARLLWNFYLSEKRRAPKIGVR